MNIIGLNFNIPNKYGSLFTDLLSEELEINSYWRRGEHEEILVPDSLENLINSNEKVLTNKQLKDIFSSKKEYYPIFATFSVYFNKQQHYPMVKTIKQFLESSCRLYVTIFDANEIILLSKDFRIIKRIQENKDGIYSNIQYLYDNDTVNLD